jgi:hypothetical protein
MVIAFIEKDTRYFSESLVVPGIVPGPPDL